MLPSAVAATVPPSPTQEEDAALDPKTETILLPEDDNAALLLQTQGGGGKAKGKRMTHLIADFPFDLLVQIFRLATDADSDQRMHGTVAGVRWPTMLPLLNRRTQSLHREHALSRGGSRIFVIGLRQTRFDPQRWRATLPRSLLSLPPPPAATPASDHHHQHHNDDKEKGDSNKNDNNKKNECFIHIIGTSSEIRMLMNKYEKKSLDIVCNYNNELCLLDIKNYAWELVGLLEALGPELRARVRRIALPMMMPLILSKLPPTASLVNEEDVQRQERISRDVFNGHSMFATLAQRTRLEDAFSEAYLPNLSTLHVVVQGYAHEQALDAFRRESPEKKAAMLEKALTMQHAVYLLGWSPIAQALRSRRAMILDKLHIVHRIAPCARQLFPMALQTMEGLSKQNLIVTPLRWGMQFASEISSVITKHECPLTEFSPQKCTLARLMELCNLHSWPQHHRTYVRHLHIETRSYLYEDEERRPIWAMLAAAGIESAELRLPDSDRTAIAFPLPRPPRLTSYSRRQRFVLHCSTERELINWLELDPPITDSERELFEAHVRSGFLHAPLV